MTLSWTKQGKWGCLFCFVLAGDTFWCLDATHNERKNKKRTRKWNFKKKNLAVVSSTVKFKYISELFYITHHSCIFIQLSISIYRLIHCHLKQASRERERPGQRGREGVREGDRQTTRKRLYGGSKYNHLSSYEGNAAQRSLLCPPIHCKKWTKQKIIRGRELDARHLITF